MLALSRAEIVERFRAPVVTQASGLVQVYADCPADLRREYQLPIARFAADTVQTLYRGANRSPERFAKPGIVIHIGDVRTNVPEVVTQVVTNDNRVVTRLYVRSPLFADVDRTRIGVIKGFYRSVMGRELTDEEAVSAYRRADPALRTADERRRLEDWLVGRGELRDDEEGLRLMRKIIEPGRASRRDVLTFASRLFLYPPTYDLRFQGGYSSLAFRDALGFGKMDPTVRLMAAVKARDMTVFGGGRGDELAAAAEAYRAFLLKLGDPESEEKELKDLLDDAERKLNVALEKAR